MTTHKKKKVTRYRGSKTHGCGSMKKRRGAGNRGGRGRAGSGKRADQKKPSYQKKNYFGKYGFIKKNQEAIQTVTLAYFEQKINKLVSDKKASEKGGIYTVDLFDLGFKKLLGTGRLTKRINFACEMASAGAVEKVKKAGGFVTVRRAASVEPEAAPAVSEESQEA